MHIFYDTLKKNKKTVIILSLIVLAGIFLRTYNFHDWLRFSRDQVRDASLISNALENKNDHLPYLGPNAGVTRFRLGPVYYQFSYISEEIFGNYPDKMAYPSVFFSILAIPLLFFFLREYFGKNVSLALTAIMSVSYFMIINARFSSNPNLIPFFILVYLYSLLKLMDSSGKMAYFWGILIGIGTGICVQLHTTLLIVLPPMSLVIFFYLWRKKTPDIWKISLVILAATLVLNTTQIMSEFDSHWKNTQYFLKGFTSSSGSGSHLGRDTFHIFACQIQANSHTISAFSSDDPCNIIFRDPQGTSAENYKYYFGITLSVIFSVIGYYLLFRYFFREKEIKKKRFLGIIILFNFLSFVILIPIAKIIFVGYFINLYMVPLVLLGLVILETEKIFGLWGKGLAAAVVVTLIILCLARDAKTAQNYMAGLENNSKNSTLSEVEHIYQYELANMSGIFPKAYLGGQNGLAERFFRPVNYFTKKRGIGTDLLKYDGLDEVPPESPVFYLRENESGEIPVGQKVWDREIITGKKFTGLTVLILKN
ncbi:MAG: glycosyltransferase family 39 protein [Parcubacteria group bacterium]|jgi:4-amino-4-deoxy-L-arabinose transferase-like glycosyltransferase